MKTVFIHNFGCRTSQADGAAIGKSLEVGGLLRVSDPRAADLVVVNTCTVTHNADVDARRVIRGLHRDHPQAPILVTGCYAQRAPEELAQLPGVAWVVGNSHKTQIAEIVARAAGTADYHGEVWVGNIASQTEFRATPVVDVQADRTRPNLKIQDGCSNRCSFCVIPSVRGRSRSANAGAVMEQLRELAERYAEVVLTGINLGRWGRDLPERPRFTDLLRELLRQTSVRRLRISSVEPMDWSEELLALVAREDRIAKHVHIPLQSGSDAVLKRMYRKYRTRHYAARLERAVRLMPDAAIGADVMTGFPGETEAEFAETVRFIEEQPFTYLHVFSYSERPGTEAASLPFQIPVPVRHERTRLLRELSCRKNLDFRRRMLGKQISAVTLEQRGLALSSNFLKVELAQARESNQLIEVQIGAVSEAGLREKDVLAVLR